MDWFDYLHALEEKHGWLYDIGGYTGSVELYRPNTRQLVGRFSMEQIKIFMQGLYIFYDIAQVAIENKKDWLDNDIEGLKKDLNSLYVDWEVKDANFNQLEEACYIKNYMLHVE